MPSKPVGTAEGFDLLLRLNIEGVCVARLGERGLAYFVEGVEAECVGRVGRGGKSFWKERTCFFERGCRTVAAPGGAASQQGCRRQGVAPVVYVCVRERWRGV